MRLDNQKKYNLFVFLSTFARGMAEIYVPIFLYNKGMSIQMIMLYFLIKYSIMTISYVPVVYLGKKIKFKWIIVFSSFLLGLAFYFISVMSNNMGDIIKLAIIFAFFTHTYWVGRHYYALEVLPKKDLGDEVGNIIIATQLALIPSAYIGALLIEMLGTTYLSMVIAVISLIAIIPIFFIKEEKITTPIDIMKVLKTIPKASLLFLAIEQLKIIITMLFPLYIFLTIESNFSYIGLLNIAIGVASMLFVYSFCRIIDKKKKDYIYLSCFLLVLVWLAKLSVATASLMLIVSILEGLTSKMHETSVTRNIYALGKNYDACSYIVVYEVFQNIIRVIILALAYFFIKDLKIFLLLSSIVFLLGAFIKFDDGKGGY